ncbi:MAG: acyl-CoA/acyl-ACP dehydrogenase [Acidobacteria bacterium]|nr:acyl-CoA/acyl-ACP dehydrogenase [Acidobacteriota bacterium]
MRFELNETQLLLQKSAREFLANECPMAEVRRLMETETAHDAGLWKKMADQGWTGMICDEEDGGMGLGMVEMAAVFEQMGRALLPGPFLSSVALAGPLVAAAGSEAKRRYLTPMIEGKACATAALIEDSAEWDPAGWRTRAEADGNGYKLHGRKMFVTDACASSFVVVAARLSGEMALFAVSKDSAGSGICRLKGMDRTRPVYEMKFEGTPAELLMKGAAAENALSHALAVATVALAAEMTGGMSKVLELTVAYAKTRKQFDQVIGKFQAVQHMCADMFLWTESSRSAVYYAAYALDKRLPEAATAVSVAKVYAGEAYREVGNRGIQVHGGMGFTWENDVHLYYRRAKASENAFGETGDHRERIARQVVG